MPTRARRKQEGAIAEGVRHPKAGYRSIHLTPRQEARLFPIGCHMREYQERELRRRPKTSEGRKALELFVKVSLDWDPIQISDVVSRLESPKEFIYLDPARPICQPWSALGQLEHQILKLRAIR